MTDAIDPITLEVLRNALEATAQEMGVVLKQTAFSPNIKERMDASCSIFDARAQLVAQAEHVPVHLGAMLRAVGPTIDAIGPLEPGDIVVVNDPFPGGGHLPDITLIAPIFAPDADAERLVGFVANRAHHSDVGGMEPGSMPAKSVEIYQEGLIIPPVRLFRRGALQEDILRMILANVRTPAERRGDLNAQIAALRIGQRRIGEMAASYGVGMLAAGFDALLDYAERRMRRRLSELPDGSYDAQDQLDEDGTDPEPVVIKVRATIAGDHLTLDFAGSAMQRRGNINAVAPLTYSGVFFAVKVLADPTIPVNAGTFRPVDIRIPKGSFLDAVAPAAVCAGNTETTHRVADTVLRAFAQIAPDRIPAASQGTMNLISIGGRDPRNGQPYTYIETICGGQGGRPLGPGMSAVQCNMTNTLNTPVEALEISYPLRVERYEIREGSGGAGHHRGGDGAVRALRILDHDARVSVQTDRRLFAPYGLGGGADGACGRNWTADAAGIRTELPGKASLTIGDGGVVVIETPGGGGWECRMKARIAADIGGTFTDIALIHPDGRVATCKVPSTPADYGGGVMDGIRQILREEALSVDQVGEVLHACTVATNAILEGKGARTALITTAGFRDVLELRRIRVPRLYEPLYRKPPPLVPRRLRLEVAERMDWQGSVLTPLDEASVATAIDALVAEGVEAVAVCLLHSYANPAHERRIGEMLRARLPDAFISLSVDILPEIREYERTSTTVINSYVGPPVRSYLESLVARMAELGLPRRLFMMHSAGGIVDARTVMRRPAQIVECGPAAGVLSARHVGALGGYRDIISFDMGGTTAKASLIENGALQRTDDYEVGGGISLSSKLAKGGGYALKLPVIDISEVGAGGGSIVWLDRAGALKVGPHSAGASPGPVCYDTGGTEPTVTDANVVLGYLNPHALAGGTLRIDGALSRAAVQRVVAGPLGLGIDAAAYGVHELVTTVMTRAVKSVTTYRGRDPREFTLFAFGGNGGIHAVSLARALGILTIVVPPGAGVFSALGLLYAEVMTGASAACLRTIDAVEDAALEAQFTALEQGIAAELDQPRDQVAMTRSAAMRYAGQAFELTLPFGDAGPYDAAAREAIRERFEAMHQRSYGYRLPGVAVEVVTLRADGKLRQDTAPVAPRHALPPASAPTRRRVWFGPALGSADTLVTGRAALAQGAIRGPVIIEEYEGTTVVPPDCTAALDEHGNIVIRVDAPDAGIARQEDVAHA